MANRDAPKLLEDKLEFGGAGGREGKKGKESRIQLFGCEVFWVSEWGRGRGCGEEVEEMFGAGAGKGGRWKAGEGGVLSF